jgi:hypothetical protein
VKLEDFGMDTITLAGPIEAKLRAVKDAGFTQIMLSARDLVGHPGGESAAVDAVRNSGLRVTGLQVRWTLKGYRDRCTPTRSILPRRCWNSPATFARR